MTEIPLKRRKSSIQQTNQPTTVYSLLVAVVQSRGQVFDNANKHPQRDKGLTGIPDGKVVVDYGFTSHSAILTER